MKPVLIICLSLILMSSDGQQLSKGNLKKLTKSITELYPGHAISFEKLNLHKEEITDTDILNSDGKWYAIRENSRVLGWFVADKVWGRYHEFEYTMVIDTDMLIKDVSVLSYPASHGNAVTNKKWLNGFTGFSPDSIPVYGREIDALSGASISGPRLSESIAKALLVLKKLDEQSLLKSQ